MATLKVKGRKELVVVSSEKASAIKALLTDVSVPRETFINAGAWSGELGEIKQIEIEQEHKQTYQPIDYSAYYLPIDEFEKYDMRKKIAYGVEWYLLAYTWRSFRGGSNIKPTEEQMARAKTLLGNWYARNARQPIPSSEYMQEVLPGGTVAGKKIASPVETPIPF